MPTWTRYSCAKCKKPIRWEGHDLYYAIGVPYLSCDDCGTVNVRSSRRNEWDLMSWPRRLPVYITTALGGLLFGTAGGLALPMLAKEKLGLTLWGPEAIWAVAGAAIGLFIFARWQTKSIHESRERLAHETYRQTLLSLGIATGSITDLRPGAMPRIFPSARRVATILGWPVAVVALFTAFAFVLEHFFGGG